MKKIAVIGCSFSRWIDPKAGQSARCWPHSLSQYNPDLEVYNYAMYVNSCNMQYKMGIEFIKHQKHFDAIILQWTTEQRSTFIIDQKKPNPYFNKIVNYGDEAPNYWHIPEKANQWMKPNREMMHLSPGTLHRYTSKEIRKNKFLYAAETYASYGVGSGGYYASREATIAMQYTLKEVARKANMPLLQMDWLSKKGSQIEHDFETVDFTVENNFKFKRYVADAGYHFGNAGADAVAKKVNAWIENNV